MQSLWGWMNFASFPRVTLPETGQTDSWVVRCPALPKAGPGQISGNLEIWDLEIWKVWTRQIQKIKILKIKIRVAQNVGKVWISRRSILLAPLGATWGQFFHGPEKCKKNAIFAYFPWQAHGPYSTALGKTNNVHQCRLTGGW